MANGVVSIVTVLLSGVMPPPFLICILPDLAFDGTVTSIVLSSITS